MQTLKMIEYPRNIISTKEPFFKIFTPNKGAFNRKI